MGNALHTLGNIPVSAATLMSLYPDIKGGQQKVLGLAKSHQIIRLKRGLYVVSPEVSGKALSMELIANSLYSPSYVSLSSALRYYGLIHEAVYTIQSMTLKHSRNFKTPVGCFTFTQIARSTYPIGIRNIQNDGYSIVIAAPEKALCDLIACSAGVNLRYLKDVEIYLYEDIRMDKEDFMNMDPSIFNEYIKVGKKPESINTLLKYYKNEKRNI